MHVYDPVGSTTSTEKPGMCRRVLALSGHAAIGCERDGDQRGPRARSSQAATASWQP